jgi:exopolyphosphatase/guanosine-5'-triphosphate,3'-diphosphate pyrophosphatase
MSNTPANLGKETESIKIPTARNSRMVAVIDVGASAIRMEIAEISETNQIRTLETVRQAVDLGKDTFTKGRIQQENIKRSVEILRGFRRIMDEYGITRSDQIQAVATSSVREAENRENFLSRIYVATQINVRAIDEAEESRLTYLAAQSILEGDPALKEGDVLVVDAGGGSTELLLVQKSFVTFADSYRVGSLRMRETLETQRAPPERVRSVLGQHIQRLIEQVKRNLPPAKPSILVAMSGDSRFAASQLCPDWADKPEARLDLKSFAAFVDKTLPLTVERLVSKYHLTYQEAETVGPALLIYVHIARAFKIDQLIVPKASLRDGMLREMALLGYWSPAFIQQVIQSAVVLSQKYHVDEKHARHVADLALLLFDELKNEHQLDQRHRLLLEVAALLHEVGGYVSSRSHHKHSMYLVLNSDLFGLTRADTTLIALTARYHRRAMPGLTHPEYTALDRDSRIVVSKLAAILRVADALDRNHAQKIRNISFAREPDRFVIKIQGVEDLTLERLAVKEKGNLFEEIYGLPVNLQELRTGTEQESYDG